MWRRAVLLVALVVLGAGRAGAERIAPDRAARLAEAERAIDAQRWDEAQAILDDLARPLEVEEAVLAARLEFALRRAGLSGAARATGPLPAEVESAAAALERRGELGHRSCLLLAEEALAAGRLEQAARWLERALAALPADDATRLRLALVQMERGRAAEAARLTLELIAAGSRCPGVLQLAGQALLAEGRTAEALGPLRALVAAAPDNAEARSLLGAALLVERRPDEAVEQLRVAAELDPSPARRANLGLALALAGRTDEALDLLRRLTAEHPGHGGAWNNLGVALALAGHLDEARAALLRALEIDPADARTRANLADLDALRAKP